MTSQISILVHGSSEAASLAACLDSLLAQKRLSWVKEILIVAPVPSDSLHNVMASRQRKAPQTVKIIAADANLAAQVAQGPWIAFITADGIAPQDWLEKLWSAFQSAQSKNPLVVGVGAPTRLVDVGGFSQTFNVMLGSPFAHFYDARWWRPQLETQVDFIGLDNGIYQRTTLMRVGWLHKEYLEQGAELELGLRLKDEGSLLMLFPGPVVMRRELSKPSQWLARWRAEGRAQEHLDRTVNPGWTLRSASAWAFAALLILLLATLPFSNWLASSILIYLLVVLNASASAAFRVREHTRTFGIFGWMIASHFSFFRGYWQGRAAHFARSIKNSNSWRRCHAFCVAPATRLFALVTARLEELLRENAPPATHPPAVPAPSITGKPLFVRNRPAPSQPMRFDLHSSQKPEAHFQVDLTSQRPSESRDPIEMAPPSL